MKYIAIETSVIAGQAPQMWPLLNEPCDRENLESLIGDDVSLFHQYGLPDYAKGENDNIPGRWLKNNAKEDDLILEGGHNPEMTFKGNSVTLWETLDENSEGPSEDESYIRYDILEVPEELSSNNEIIAWGINKIANSIRK